MWRMPKIRKRVGEILNRNVMNGYMIIVIPICALIGKWVQKDANNRGMNGVAWGLFVFLIVII